MDTTSDAFTDLNGQPLQTHVMDDGPGWEVLSGTWQIISNRAVRSTAGDNEAAVVECGGADGEVQVVANSGDSTAGGVVGMVVRAVDSSHYWVFVFPASGSGTTATLYQRQAGVNTARATGTVAPVSATDYTLKVVMAGALIRCYVDAVLICSYASASFQQTASKHGLYASGASPTGRTFNDFAVVP